MGVPPARAKAQGGVMNESGLKRGEVWKVVSVLCLMAAALLLVATFEDDERIANLRRDGVTAQAVVIGRSERPFAENDFRGRPRSRTARVIRLSYDPHSTTPHSAYEAGRPIPPPMGHERRLVDIPVGSPDFARFVEGSRVMVTYLPAESGQADLSEWVKARGGNTQRLMQMLVAGLLAVVGIWAARGWWRTRG